MAETIRARFTPNADDYGRVMRAHTVRRRTVWLSLAAITILVFLFAWSSLARNQGRDVLLWVVDFLLIYAANKRTVQFVPKRAFESPEQEEAFRTLLQRKLRVAHWA